MDALLDDNLLCLQQAVEIIAPLSAEVYTRRCATCYNSSAGGHLRHVADHYQSFLLGVGNGSVDYDARERDPQVENDPLYAAALLRGITMGLEQFDEDLLSRPLKVKMDAGTSAEWSASSVRRELQFLLSHAVHHFALIATILQTNDGTKLPSHFGVAPSTAKYESED